MTDAVAAPAARPARGAPLQAWAALVQSLPEAAWVIDGCSLCVVAANARAVSRPRPPLAPVTTAVRPVWSGMSVVFQGTGSCSSVGAASAPDGPPQRIDEGQHRSDGQEL